MTAIAKFFLDNKKFTVVLTLFVVFFGLGGLRLLKSESFPAVDFAMATVTTVYDGASAEDVETKITKKIEDEIRGVSGIRDVRSTSQAGLSTIFIRGDIDNVNVPRLMADLQRAVDRTVLPNDLEDPPAFLEMKSEEFPVIELAIVGSNENRQRDIVADLLKEEIEDDKNILNVRPAGFRERAFEIELNTDRMRVLHIGVNEVVKAIERRNVNIPGGHLRESSTQQLLRVEGKVKNKEDIENILVRSNASGQAIFLKDIATVTDGMEEAKVYARHNGREATLLVATKKAGADTIQLAQAIDEKVEAFREKYKGRFEFHVYANEAMEVKNRLAVLASNAWTGMALVILFLLIFLPGRIGIMASLSLPVATLATMGFMPIFGMNLDAITILALVIALGMLVDNSVVISENYARLLSEGKTPREATVESIRTLWLPISGTVFTTIAAFLPMLVTKGIMGQFIKFIPILVSIALLMSLLESFFFLPTRLEGISANMKKSGGDWFQRNFIPKFESFMRKAVRHRYITWAVFFVMIVISFLFMTLGNQFILFPADQTKLYAARVEMPTGTRLEATDSEMARLSRQIEEALPNMIDHQVARSGISNLGPGDPKAKESQDVGMIIIYVNEHTEKNVPHTEVLDRLRTVKSEIAQVQFEAQINGPPVGEPVNATFRSNNGENLDRVIQAAMKKLSGTPGIIDVQVQDVIGDDEVYVDIDYTKADLLGLDVDSVGNAIRTAISGKVVSDVNLNNKEVDLFVRFQDRARKNIQDLGSLTVLGRNGHLVPLSAFATFHVQKGSPQVKRFDYKRSRTVTANIDAKLISAIEANQVLKDTYAELKNQYKDVSLIFGGEEENTKESMDSLWNALVLSLIGIFALLVFLFNSYLRPVIIMSTIPLGLIGFSIAFSLHQRPISFLALIGVIGLGGIIVNSGIILITFIDELRKNSNLALEEILAKASGLRLRAVFVSSLTTISGLLPTAYGIGGSDAMLVPMTLAMAWGLTSGTILTLIWVPCFYAIIEDFVSIPERLRNRKFAHSGTNGRGRIEGVSL